MLLNWLNKKKASTKFDDIKVSKRKPVHLSISPQEFQFNQDFLHDTAAIQFILIELLEDYMEICFRKS